MLADFFKRFGVLLVQFYPVFEALVEALEGDTDPDALVASIRAAQIKVTEAAVEADLGPRS